jgi:hypothetical protein
MTQTLNGFHSGFSVLFVLTVPEMTDAEDSAPDAFCAETGMQDKSSKDAASVIRVFGLIIFRNLFYYCSCTGSAVRHISGIRQHAAESDREFHVKARLGLAYLRQDLLIIAI